MVDLVGHVYGEWHGRHHHSGLWDVSVSNYMLCDRFGHHGELALSHRQRVEDGGMSTIRGRFVRKYVADLLVQSINKNACIIHSYDRNKNRHRGFVGQNTTELHGHE